MNSKINSQKPEVILVLHNIRSTHNVGSLFRSADGAGVSHIIISGFTPEPVDRFGRPRNDIKKTALGAENTVGWTKINNIFDFIKQKKSEGYLVSAIEQHPNSVLYKDSKNASKQVLILGNEVLGVDSSLLDLVDQIIEIPMAGEKESLNVSIAGSIVLFEILC